MEPEAAAKKAVKQSLSEAGKQYPKGSSEHTGSSLIHLLQCLSIE
jgi:hypothetical protein